MEEWAGSTPIRSNSNGRIAPRQTLVNTIRDSDAVTVIASGNGVLKKIVRQKPAMERMKLKVAAILTSRMRNCPLVRSLSVPKAMPRMTDETKHEKLQFQEIV